MHATTFFGAASVGTTNISFVRIGSLVTMTILQPIIFTATATQHLTTSTSIPSRFRPSGDQYKQIEILENAINTDGTCSVPSYGVTVLARTHMNFFQTGQPYIILPFSLSWSIA